MKLTEAPEATVAERHRLQFVQPQRSKPSRRKQICIPDVKAPDIRDFFSRMRVETQEDRSHWKSGVLKIDPNEKVDPRLAELMEGR